MPTPRRSPSKISAQPGTDSYFSTGQTQVSVAGLAGPTEVDRLSGRSAGGAYQMISGSLVQPSGPGRRTRPLFLTATGTHVGSTTP